MLDSFTTKKSMREPHTMFRTVFIVIILFFSTLITINSVLAGGQATKIYTTLVIDEIKDIDLSIGTFEITAEILQEWQDDGKINKALGNPTTEIVLSGDQINKLNLVTELPKFLIANSNERRTTVIRTMVIKPDGMIELYEKFLSINRIHTNLRGYPFGKLALTIEVEAATMNKNDVIFVNSELQFRNHPERINQYSQIGIQNFLEHSWSKVGESFKERNFKSLQLSRKAEFSAIDYHIIVVRKLSHDLQNIFLPFGVIIFFSFMINRFCPIIYGSNSDFRISGQLTLFLTIFALKFSLSDDIPKMNYLNFIDAIIIASSTIIAIALISGIYVNYINYTAPTKVVRIDKLTNLAMIFTAIITGCWCLTFLA